MLPYRAGSISTVGPRGRAVDPVLFGLFPVETNKGDAGYNNPYAAAETHTFPWIADFVLVKHKETRYNETGALLAVWEGDSPA